MGPGGALLEDVTEIREGHHAVQAAGLDQGIDRRRPFTAGVVIRKGTLFPVMQLFA